RRHDQGLCGDSQGAPAVGARRADRRRSRAARPLCLGMARRVGAQGHAGGCHHQAEWRDREGAGRARHARKTRGAGPGDPARRPAHAAGAGRLPEGRDREVVADRQGRGHQGRMTMKLGVLQFFSWPGRHGPLEQVYARALERIEIMDRGGFDAVWLAEHHFTTFSVCPSVHMLGTLAAARTKRLRIGTAVSLAALYHPLRLAEEVALLDMLSGGRVNWGAGRGFAHSEFNAFGVPPEQSAERFREAVEIVLKAWTEERFTYKGAHFRFDDIEVLPKPLQRPHPPTWMAAAAPPAIEWAATRGFSILMDPHASMTEIGVKRRLYAGKLAEAGFSDKGRDIPMARLIALGPTTAKAEEIARRGAQWLGDSHSGPQHTARKSMQAPRTYDGKEPVQYYLDSVILHGTPDSVVDQVARLKEEIGLNYLMAAPLSRDSFTLLVDKVLPRL